MDRSPASRIQAANSAILVDGNLDAIGDFFAPDCVVHLTDHDARDGVDAIRGFVEMVRRAFPDLQIEVEVLVEGEDRIAWQRTVQGTHERDFMGFPASGRRVVWRDMVTSRFRAGMIAEEWVITDLAERLLRSRKL